MAKGGYLYFDMERRAETSLLCSLKDSHEELLSLIKLSMKDSGWDSRVIDGDYWGMALSPLAYTDHGHAILVSPVDPKVLKAVYNVRPKGPRV